MTVEEHSTYGGLGGLVAEVLSASGRPRPVHRVALEDTWVESGSNAYLLDRYGLSTDAVAARVRSLADGLPRMNNGRSAVVTGGASGIGAACAAVLARDDWRVGVLDLSAAAAKEVADALPGTGHVGVECDVTSATSVDVAVG